MKQSKTAKARQYVLIELFRNVFLENTMNEIMLPKIPIETTAVREIVIAVSKFMSKEKDILINFLFLFYLIIAVLIVLLLFYIFSILFYLYKKARPLIGSYII